MHCGGVGFLFAVAAVVWDENYWTFGRFIESTDAYVLADSTMVAPKVSSRECEAGRLRISASIHSRETT
jgi:hypothetical protein